MERPQPTEKPLTREEVARIVDPVAWAEWKVQVGMEANAELGRRRRQSDALAKADAILALAAAPPPPVEVEPVAFIIERDSGDIDVRNIQRVFLAEMYDPRKPDFWLDGKAPDGFSVTPLYTHPATSREGK